MGHCRHWSAGCVPLFGWKLPGAHDMHAVLPGPGCACPAAQYAHDSALSSAYEPAGQGKHNDAPGSGAVQPRGHALQAVCAEVFEKVPGAHSQHWEVGAAA
jgi:hypothetical protein